MNKIVSCQNLDLLHDLSEILKSSGRNKIEDFSFQDLRILYDVLA